MAILSCSISSSSTTVNSSVLTFSWLSLYLPNLLTIILSTITVPIIESKTEKAIIIIKLDVKLIWVLLSIYAAGDVISKSLYQVVTATGEGALAASSIIKSLKK